MPEKKHFTLRLEFELTDPASNDFRNVDPSIYYLDNFELEVVEAKSDVITEVLFHETSKKIKSYEYSISSESIDHWSYGDNSNWIKMNDADWVEYIISTKELFSESGTNGFSIHMSYNDGFNGSNVGKLGFVLQVYVNGDKVGVIDINILTVDGFQSLLKSNVFTVPEYIAEQGDSSIMVRLAVERKINNPYKYADNLFALGSFEIVIE